MLLTEATFHLLISLLKDVAWKKALNMLETDDTFHSLMVELNDLA